MPALNEATQTGVYESWEEAIANVEAPNTPFMTLLKKTKKNSDARVTSSQVESYNKPRTTGVPDGVDANQPSSQTRGLIDSCIQKTWQQPAVTDISQEMDVHGITDEMAHQIEQALVVSKHSIESSLLSEWDMNDTEPGLRTRGAFSYLQTAAQATRPVPAGYRPSGRYTGTLANFTEAAFKALAISAYKERNAKANMLGLVGIDLKGVFDTWLSYRDTVANKLQVQSLNMDAAAKTYLECVDRIEITSCSVDLMVAPFLRYSLADEAEPTAGTHLSGLFVVPDMWNFNYMRAPRVVRLPYQGGGHKAIVDAIFELRCLNPLGQFSAVIDS